MPYAECEFHSSLHQSTEVGLILEQKCKNVESCMLQFQTESEVGGREGTGFTMFSTFHRPSILWHTQVGGLLL